MVQSKEGTGVLLVDPSAGIGGTSLQVYMLLILLLICS